MKNDILQVKLPMSGYELENNFGNTFMLKNFLLNHFDFPDDNFDEILNFISDDEEMVRMIFDVPDIFLHEGLTSKPMLNFMGYCDPGEVILEIIVYSDFDSDTSIQKRMFFLKYLIHHYDVENDYVLMVVK